MRLADRFSLDAEKNLFFINFEGHDVATSEDVHAIREEVERRLGSLATKTHAVVNYDNFSLRPEVLDEYSAMVVTLADRFYSGVTRYTTSGFLRMKLGDALKGRQVAPYIYESSETPKEPAHSAASGVVL
jgi:propionate CoA-transferase